MSKHFFLIDDDDDELDIFMEAMAKLPFACKCTYASKSEQALDMLNYLTPDVIFIDMDMPLINGFDCVRRIREKANHKETNIVLYFNNLPDELAREAVATGVTSCVRKTISISELVKAMEGVLRSTPARASSLSAQ